MKSMKGKFAVAVVILAVPALSFGIMTAALSVEMSPLDMLSVNGNTVDLSESSPAAIADTPDMNAISKEQAKRIAVHALTARGDIGAPFRTQHEETMYMSGTAPASDPVWIVILRTDSFKDLTRRPTKDKNLADALAEGWTDGKETSGQRGYIRYTIYTVAEINAMNGECVRFGQGVNDNSELPNMNEILWYYPEVEMQKQEQEKLDGELKNEVENKERQEKN